MKPGPPRARKSHKQHLPSRPHLHVGLLVLVDDGVGHHLDVALDLPVGKLPADQALDIVDGAVRVGRGLVLRSVTDQALAVGEGDVGRGDAVALRLGQSVD